MSERTILDIYGTHKTQRIRNRLAKRPRFHRHFTPTSASWINLAERWFAALTEKQLRRGVHRSTKKLKQAIRSFIHHHNRDPKPFVWHKTADQILDSVARFRTRTLDSAHSRTGTPMTSQDGHIFSQSLDCVISKSFCND